MSKLRISYCAASPIHGDYQAGIVTISEANLTRWIFEQISNGKPLLITDMDEIAQPIKVVTPHQYVAPTPLGQPITPDPVTPETSK